MTQIQRSALVADTNSRLNKIWLAIDWKHRGLHVEWRWAGRPNRSRVEVQLEAGGPWIQCKSYDDDVKPFLDEVRSKSAAVDD